LEFSYLKTVAPALIFHLRPQFDADRNRSCRKAESPSCDAAMQSGPVVRTPYRRGCKYRVGRTYCSQAHYGCRPRGSAHEKPLVFPE
jgi:hypothetical protein